MKISKEEFFVSNAQAVKLVFPEDVVVSDSLYNTHRDRLRSIILEYTEYDIEESEIDRIYKDNVMTLQFIYDKPVSIGVRGFRGFIMDCDSDKTLYAPDDEMIATLNHIDLFGARDFEKGNRFDLLNPVIIDDRLGEVQYLLVTYVNTIEPITLPITVDRKGGLICNLLKDDEE